MVYFNVDLVKKPKRISFVLQRTPLLPCLQAVFFSSKQFQNLTHQPFLTPTTYIYFWRAFIQLVQCEWWQNTLPRLSEISEKNWSTSTYSP